MNERSTELSILIRKAGGVTEVAKALGITAVNLYDFIRRGDIAPKHAPKIELLTQGKVKCEQLSRTVDWKIVRQTAVDEYMKKLINTHRRS